MTNLFIFKIQFPPIPLKNDTLDHASFKAQLDIMLKHTLYHITAQEYNTWECFIQYPSILSTLFNEILPHYHIPPHIHFTSSLSSDLHSYIATLDLTTVSQIMFIHLSAHTLCPINFLTELNKLTITPPTRILLLDTLTSYNHLTNTFSLPISDIQQTPLQDFIYVASSTEYIRYLKIYDLLHPEIMLNFFLSMPHETFTQPLLRIQPSLIGGFINE